MDVLYLLMGDSGCFYAEDSPLVQIKIRNTLLPDAGNV
jgi:hypothetical protein